MPGSPQSHFASSAQEASTLSAGIKLRMPRLIESRGYDDNDCDDQSLLTYVSSREEATKRRRVMPVPTIVISTETENNMVISLPLPSQLTSPAPEPVSSPACHIPTTQSSLPSLTPPQPFVPFDPVDIPSPPPSTPDEEDTRSTGTCPAGGDVSHTNERRVRPPSKVTLEEQSKAPTFSEDSAYFSFAHRDRSLLSSRTPSQDMKKSLKSDVSPVYNAGSTTVVQQENTSQVITEKPYYTKAFNYVLCDVLSRYGNVLHPSDIELARYLQQSLSDNALALFVRLYRRKHQWLQVDDLVGAYESEIDVSSGMNELCTSGLLVSSKNALRAVPKLTPLLARELLPTLQLSQIRAVCTSVVEGHVIRRLPKAKLIPKLQKILTEEGSQDCRRKKRLRQTTLSGLSPSQCLARAILCHTGHCVILPVNVLTSLARVHFLFFLESGHDSPNVILADTGKVRFPSYVCKPRIPVIPSSKAYDDFESAIVFERELATALEGNDLILAAALGSVAELEVREFYAERAGTSLECMRNNDSMETGKSYIPKKLQTNTSSMHLESQLKHPFLRRYSAQWVYARACWHSVQALEKLGEYEGAITRLKLLLGTKLMARRRGKCLNRLTINLFRNVYRPKEALDVIIDALREDSHMLTYGDKVALAQRGAAIHRVLYISELTEQQRSAEKPKQRRKKPKSTDADGSQPVEIAKVLRENATKVALRKIHGKSLKIVRRERRKKINEVEDGWDRFLAENSRDSIASASDDGDARADMDVMGKAIFKSLDGNRAGISVEQYCLDWYFAKEGWAGRHDEGSSIRFLFGLLMWESVLFAEVDDVFQTPYQDRPLDLITEAFYMSREETILRRVEELKSCSRDVLREEVMALYEKFSETRAVGCSWKLYSAEELGCIAAGLGPDVIAICCRLLCEDYSYWAGGLPDLTLWKIVPKISNNDNLPVSKSDEGQFRYDAKLVEVKSARDNLSDRQRAWLVQLAMNGANCEVCKVVENLTALNSVELEDAKLDHMEIQNLVAARESRQDE